MADNNRLSATGSERLDLLRFPLIVCVVFVHAYETTVRLSGQVIGAQDHVFVVGFVRDLISLGLASVANPLFFLMSGYLFYLGFDGSWQHYVLKLKTRVRSLLMPFLFWNLLTLSMWALFQHWSLTQALFSGSHPDVASMGWREGLAAVWGIGREPIAYQFWFIRDLMVLVVLTPLISVLLRDKRVAALTLAALFFCWGMDIWWLAFPTIGATSFFVLGGFLAATARGLFVLDAFGTALLLTFPVVLLADATAISLNVSIWWLHKLDLVVGVAAFLCLSASLHRCSPIRRALLTLSPASFFIYAAHEPLLMLSRKLAYKMLAPRSDWTVLGLYFAVPIVVILTLLKLRQVLMHAAPAFTRLITGGR